MFTPRTLLRSKTMTLALLVSGLIAAFGISLVMLAFFGACGSHQNYQEPIVETVVETTFDCSAPTQGTVSQWLAHIDCERANGVPAAMQASTVALTFHPTSEALYNKKGILALEINDYKSAWRTLWKGRQNARLTNGTLENNLAWSGAWLGVDAVELAPIYKSSLKREPNSCETIHTGMWIEYNIASDSVTTRRDRAIQNYVQLRRQYAPCANRSTGLSDATFALEILSAGVMDHEMDMIARTTGVGRGYNNASLPTTNSASLMRQASQLHAQNIPKMCREAMPNGKAISTCAKLMSSSVSKTKVRGF